MRFDRATRVLASWMAVLAILVAALAPSISHALSAEKGASLIEVCTSLGAKWVLPDGSASEPAPGSGDVHSLEQCLGCSFHANATTIPADRVALAPALALPGLRPTAFVWAPRTRHAWLSAPPRAPPQFS